MAEFGTAQVGSLVAAAMETAGTALQSRMLDLVTGEQGQILAGLFFLIAVATALIVYVSSGSYRWGRYLLIGPPLFFFLTEVRVASDGTEWRFGDQAYPNELRDRALRGVLDFADGARGGHDVSLFFLVWNVLLSELTQQLIDLLNLTDDESHLNFINKIERYMSFFDFNYIDDENLRILIHMAMVPNCANYFMLRKMVSDPHTPDSVRDYYRPHLQQWANYPALSMMEIDDPEQNALFNWMGEQGFDPNRVYSCQELWTEVVEYMRPRIANAIMNDLSSATQPVQGTVPIFTNFLRKIMTETSRVSSMTFQLGPAQSPHSSANGPPPSPETIADLLSSSPFFEDALLAAVDWVISRTLFQQIWDRNPFADSFDFEGHSFIATTQIGDPLLQADQNLSTSSALQQFNYTEKYQFRGDVLNAALAMPHFQGVMLMLLAAAFPFFAMMAVVPNKAGAILVWMGLWAWVKLWDLGFAVVMMIDNILYALFPRGPNLEPGQINDAGAAWTRIMEIDPNYATATYTNLIAACLFAVPLASGLLVKTAGGELIELVQGTWKQQAQRLAGSAGTFVRSLQAQSYASRLQKHVMTQGAIAGAKAVFSKETSDRLTEFAKLSAIRGGVNKDTAKALAGIPGLSHISVPLVSSAAVLDNLAKERMEMLSREMANHTVSAGQQAAYYTSVSPAGFWASERAVAARYYTHDFAHPHPGQAIMNYDYSQKLYNRDNIFSGTGNDISGSVIDYLFGGSAPKGGKGGK